MIDFEKIEPICPVSADLSDPHTVSVMLPGALVDALLDTLGTLAQDLHHALAQTHDLAAPAGTSAGRLVAHHLRPVQHAKGLLKHVDDNCPWRQL